jgi:hypothetical protein
MGLLDDVNRAVRDGDDRDTGTNTERETPDTSDGMGTATAQVDQSFRTTIRGQEVIIDGREETIEQPETAQPTDEGGNWLTGNDAYGVPRRIDAAKLRNIAQTAPMQSICNGIADQLLGGELTFLDNEDAMTDLSSAEQRAAEQLKDVIRDVLTGPHMGDEDLDDLVTAAVEDMLGPGNAYWQLLAPESGSLPVVSLTTLDPLTIRHNLNRHGYFEDPPYYQAIGAFGQSGGQSGGFYEPVPLQKSDLAVMRYPKGNRSYQYYPTSATHQVKEWLELLADETVHVKRFYSDSEYQTGLLQLVEGNDHTVESIQNEIEQASTDPRDIAVVGGPPANFVELGGKAVNLDVIQEQQWFFEMCLGALGLGKAEVGMIEDVNRANGEIEAERVYKRVGQSFGKQFEKVFMHIARQFDAFTELGEPFTPTLAYTDPRAEQAKQERLRKEWEAGKLTLRQYVRRAGDEDIAEDEDEYTVTLDGETINYGDHPKWVATRLLSAAGAAEPNEEPTVGGDDAEQSARHLRQPEFPTTDYPEAASENAQMALDARDETGNPNNCGTDTGWARANQLADREAISEETVRRMAAFRRHQDNAEMEDDEGRADCGWMMWKAWGGEEGVAWAERVVDELEGE